MENNFRPVLTIRIFGEDKCFGPGVAVLLRRVRELHSLRAAAMSIGMAYSKAWTILKNAQLSLGFKLLEPTRPKPQKPKSCTSTNFACLLFFMEAPLNSFEICSTLFVTQLFA